MNNVDEGIEAALSFQRGEERGFEFFFNKHFYELEVHAYRILKDVFMPKDAVENAFIKIWQLHYSFDHPKIIRSWLYTCVKNECLYILNNQKSRERHNGIYYNLTDEILQCHEIDMIKKEKYDQIHCFLERLPKECRKIICMLYFEGMSPNEISIKLNTSPSTIKTQKARGLRLLRQLFNLSEEKYIQNLEKKVKNIMTSEVPMATLARRYNMDRVSILHIRKNGIRDVRNMRKTV